MKYSFITIMIVLALICFQGFSQKSAQNIKTDSKEIQLTNKDLEPKAYCSSSYSDPDDDWITNVTFNSINNSTGPEGAPDSYGDYTFSHISGVLAGSTYALSVTFYSGTYIQHVRAWFDWNDDDIFSSSESYYLGSGVSETKTINITVPVNADLGDTRFRIIEQYSTDPGADGACDGTGNHGTTYGETEDYTVVIYSNSYCQASGGCDEFIWIVEFPDHGYSHSSGCIGYEDFAPYWSIPVPLNTSANLTIVNGNPIYPQDQCGVWVDWNRDDDFYDANEQITVNGSPGVGPYFATLVPPLGATLGECVVRIRIQYTSGSMDPCGLMPYGEVEDYRINLLPEVPCTWTGAVDNNWHNPDNWNTTHIPNSTTDVIIPNVTNKCWVYEYGVPADCNNLTVESGTSHDLRVYNTQLTVHGNMEVYGMVTLDHPSSTLEVEGTINWQSGSTLFIPELTYAIVEVHGDWITQSGSNIYFNHGLLSFEGTGGSYLRTFSSNCNFYDIAAYKIGGTQWVSVSTNSTHDLNINGRLMVMDDDILYIYSSHDVNLVGDLDIMGHLYCYDGDFIFDGDIQEIDEHPSYSTTCEFYNLKVSSTSSTTILNKDISISKNLSIESGQFNSNDHTISISGNWTNNVGDAGFIESSGTVFFDGNTNSTLYTDETFYNLLLSNASSGIFGLTLMDGINVHVSNNLDLYWSTLEMNNASELHVGGDVYIALGGGLNADDGGNILSVGGNWTNENSNNTQYYGYWKGGEVVTFNGAGDQILNTDDSEETFGNIIIDKPSGYFRPNDDIHIHGALIIQDGDWWDNIAGLDHWLTGHILIEVDGGYYPEGTTTFKGLNYQTYQNNGGSAVFGDIVIDKHYTKNLSDSSKIGKNLENTKGGTLELLSNMVVFNSHTTIIEEGTLDLNGNSFKSHGDIYINDGGILEVDAGAWCSIVSGLYVNNGGEFKASGVSGNNAHVWQDVIGNYDFQVKSGATISANYTDFDDMNNDGIWVQDGAYVDPANPFSNCNFINGINTTNSARLVINTDQVLNISNINFDNNPFISGAFNIAKAINQGELNISNYGGDFSGYDFEYDPYDRIHWVIDAYTVYGNVTYANVASTPLSDVTATFMDGAVPVTSDLSDISGNLVFPDIPVGTYHIESTTTKSTGGLSMNDVQYARQYVTNQPPGNGLTGLQLQAGDVNDDGNLFMNDVLAMWQEVTITPPGFTSFWIFEEPSVIVTGGMGVQSYQGISAGDTDASYVPPLAK